MADAMFPALVDDPGPQEAVTCAGRGLTYAELAAATGELAGRITPGSRVGVWATPTLETCVALVGTLLAGAVAVPLNPKLGERELTHVLDDSAPDLVFAGADEQLPPEIETRSVGRLDCSAAPSTGPRVVAEPSPQAPAIIVYTSGTTGPPKGVVLSRRAIMTNLDALARAWEWTEADVVVHGLPLFHVHGLILGVLGPLRRGGAARHLGKFCPRAVAEELAGSATMLFGVPTMYRRLAEQAEAEPALASSLASARLLVSGSAALPAVEHERIERLTGQRVVERYGMSETLMNCGVRAAGDRRPGYVGPPIDGVDVRLIDDSGAEIAGSDDETVGEIVVRGPNVFTEYLNLPEATAGAFVDGWFRTGDAATRAPDGYLRIVGRKATDLIKSGGYRIGAGEIENALLEHPDVCEVAVLGEPDADLGERIVAWVVSEGTPPAESVLVEHVATLLTPHKRPREVRFVDALPRNELGKVMKKKLRG